MEVLLVALAIGFVTVGHLYSTALSGTDIFIIILVLGFTIVGFLLLRQTDAYVNKNAQMVHFVNDTMLYVAAVIWAFEFCIMSLKSRLTVLVESDFGVFGKTILNVFSLALTYLLFQYFNEESFASILSLTSWCMAILLITLFMEPVADFGFFSSLIGSIFGYTLATFKNHADFDDIVIIAACLCVILYFARNLMGAWANKRKVAAERKREMEMVNAQRMSRNYSF